MILPPGTILQLMYLKERLRARPPGSFIEIGVGEGTLSACLLSLGWSGVGYELDAESAARAQSLNQVAVDHGRYRVSTGDWLRRPGAGRADLILSSMVLEHLSDADEALYLRRCHEHLSPDGTAILFVPGSPRDWGIEDETAGHQRRYAYAPLRGVLEREGWSVKHMAGLTFPLSNVALPLSNYLVRRAEAQKKALTPMERTRLSGRREIMGKTRFPGIAGLLLNEYALYPFHLLQKLCSRAERALVIYVEFSAALAR